MSARWRGQRGAPPIYRPGNPAAPGRWTACRCPPFGSVLKVASGEAILSTPFRFLVQRKVKRFARAVALGERLTLQVTMPLPKGVFLRASRSFWTQYGAKNGITPEQMASLEIEDGKLP